MEKGKRNWVFCDGYLPPKGDNPEFEGHEALMMTNLNDEKTNIELVFVFEDKDPIGGIWELADPVVSPAHTPRLDGTPNELKLKYFADNDFANLSGEELEEAMRSAIAEKDGSLVGSMQSQGTTPRRYSDLIGSLCDLVSGSGDRGTPVVFIKGYFTNFATE